MLDDALSALQGYGSPALALVIFASCLGLPLPGTMLLLAAGAFARAGLLKVELVTPLVLLAAVIGDSCSYLMGRRMGTVLVRRLQGLTLVEPGGTHLRSLGSLGYPAHPVPTHASGLADEPHRRRWAFPFPSFRGSLLPWRGSVGLAFRRPGLSIRRHLADRWCVCRGSERVAGRLRPRGTRRVRDLRALAAPYNTGGAYTSAQLASGSFAVSGDYRGASRCHSAVCGLEEL